MIKPNLISIKILTLIFLTSTRLWAQPPQIKIDCYQNETNLMTKATASGPLGSHWNVFEMICEVNWTLNKQSPITGTMEIGIEGTTQKIIKEIILEPQNQLGKFRFTLSQPELDTIPQKIHLKNAPGGGTLEAYELQVYAVLKKPTAKPTRVTNKYLLSYGE